MKQLLAVTLLLMFTSGAFLAPVESATQQEIERQHQQTKEKIQRLKWLETVETNKLYKNQQKLENAKSTLETSKTKLVTTQNELVDMEYKLFRAINEYKELNENLQNHVRNVYKIKRRAICELLMNASDINILVDRLYFQKIILKKDFLLK